MIIFIKNTTNKILKHPFNVNKDLIMTFNRRVVLVRVNMSIHNNNVYNVYKDLLLSSKANFALISVFHTINKINVHNVYKDIPLETINALISANNTIKNQVNVIDV